ncbi:glycosyltransferase family 2 protein [Sphingomonas sp. Leaf4]|uniref:glycosyltransferase family 2 protein n=1 Tax=Sphingomonas sp. Leaf4 TaxID=2876553 RepID=UPI001E3BC0A1|nr:glycosyltransferase [Sphingomonas sp. Leaf4]
MNIEKSADVIPVGSLPPLQIAVLVTSHNRRDITVRAIRALEQARHVADLLIILLDDGSTDGTADAVAAISPQTTILRGSGDNFWNGGLHKAWKHALTLNVDAFLWLNDDVLLDADGLNRLVVQHGRLRASLGHDRFILAGATRDAAGRLTYSGKRWHASPWSFRLDIVEPDAADVRAIDTFNGNIVLVPQAVVDVIGINDSAFLHNLGDYDYGLRASRRGIDVLLMPGTLGICEANNRKRNGNYGAPGLPLSEQWKLVNTHRGVPFRDWWRITRRFSGAWLPFHFLLPYRWLVLPRRGRS